MKELLRKIKKKYGKAQKKYGMWVLPGAVCYVLNRGMIVLLKKCIKRVKNKQLIFETKPDFSDNGRALHEYMIENHYNEKYKIIWLVEDPKKFAKYQVKNVKFVRSINSRYLWRTVSAYYYSLTSKYVFFTHNFKWVKEKTKDQIYINLWHGCGYKSSRRPEGAENANVFDYCLVPGTLFKKSKAKFFDCTEDQVLPIGYPRYDLYKRDNQNVDRYLNSLSEEKCKNIIWMPTFIQSTDLIYYKNPIPNIIGLAFLNSINDLQKLEDVCAEYHVNLIIKSHRIGRTVGQGGKDLKKNHIFFLDNDDLEKMDIQLYELLNKTDALITDYSSAAVDYLLLDKPIAFVLESFDDYAKTRGVIFPNTKDYMPGSHIYTFEELKKFIEEVSCGIDSTSEKRAEVLPIMQNRSESYSKQVLDYFHIVL